MSAESLPLDWSAYFDKKCCRICGCTELDACPGPCWWVVDPLGRGDLCSACLPIAEHGPAEMYLAADVLLYRRVEVVPGCEKAGIT